MADKNSITPNQIKQENRKLIYHYIYEKKRVSQQDICFDLRLSRPTVMTNLNQLEDMGLIQKSGQIDSEVVGRKAVGYGIVPEYRVAIGVEIVKREIKMMALNLYGQRISRVAVPISFENTDTYFQKVSSHILSFISDLDLTEQQILGVGFSLQALVSPDGATVVYGKILNCTGLSIDAFRKYLPYPCRFLHDADSAAVSELWANHELQEAFYLSISKHVAGAIIHNRKILFGKHGHCATFEHIPLRTRMQLTQAKSLEELQGKLCYCGKRGCIDTLCSLHELLHPEEDLDDFFQKKAQGDADSQERWRIFLANLGEVLNMLHLTYDTDFVLGGYLAPYLTEADLMQIYDTIQEMTSFVEPSDFLQISKMPKHSITMGGALIFIGEFLRQNPAQCP